MWDFGSATLKSITAYRNLDGFSTSDPDGTGYRLYDQNTTTRPDQFSQELQLSGTAAGDRLSYLIGGYYFRENVDQVLALCFAPITPRPVARFNHCNTWTRCNDQKTTSFAVFGQGRFNVTEALSVTLGGRYTWEDNGIVSNQFFDFRPAGFSPAPGIMLPGFVGPIVTNLTSPLNFRKFTPRAGIEYRASDDVLLFVSYAKEVRSGGFNGRLVAPQSFLPTFEPDSNDSYEAGIKSDILDRTLRLNITGFCSK